MYTKIVDLFSAVVFSTSVVTTDLPIFAFSRSTNPYGEKPVNLVDMSVLDNKVFEKPVYFLWDVSTFLSRWEFYISAIRSNVDVRFFVFSFPDCKQSLGSYDVASHHDKNYIFQVVPITVFKELSGGKRIGYRFNNRILSLGHSDSYSVSIVDLINYYLKLGDLDKVEFFYKFLSSFIDYDCRTGFGISTSHLPGGVYLVPKWSNFSGVNLRYFYLSVYNTSFSTLQYYRYIDVTLLSVDLKSRYIKDNLILYPVVSSSSSISFNIPGRSNYYRSSYINLFFSGLSTSFSYNTIVISFPAHIIAQDPSDFPVTPIVRFMNFSMLDATSMTGWNPDGNTAGWGVFDVVNSQSCVWYDIFCHITAAVGWVMNNIVGFKQLSKLVNLFFTPMNLTLKTFDHYNRWFGDLPLVSPVVVNGAMLLVLFNFYRRFK